VEDPPVAPGTAKKSDPSNLPAPGEIPEEEPGIKLSRTASPRGRAASSPPPRDEIRQMAESLGRLADEGRLRILFLLEEASRNVAALGDALGKDRHSLSHHLRILRVSGLIVSTRDGRRVDYSLTPRGRLGVKAARSLNG